MPTDAPSPAPSNPPAATPVRWAARILEDSIRTMVAAVLSLAAASLCRLPESYWASITAIIVITQPALGSAIDVSIQRLIGTAIGAVLAATIAMFLPISIATYALGLFISSIVCHVLRLGLSAIRFSAITLAIVLLIVRNQNHWTIAIHRFIEVTIGIAVGLAVMLLWPTRPPRQSH